MFPLDTSAIPTTADGWRDALASTLTRWIAGSVHLEVTGETPALATVDIDVSGGRLSDDPPPVGELVGPAEVGPTVARFTARGAPLIVRRIPVSLELSAHGAAFMVGRISAGKVMVNLTHATDGRAMVHLNLTDLDAALLAAARAGAAPHGVEILAAKAQLIPHGPREIDVALDLTAKKFMKFTVRVTGRLSVDDAMTATATNLKVDGSGMAAGFAAGILRSQLAKLEGQRLPLMAFNLGDVRLRDVAVDVSNGLTLRAAFGSATPSQAG